MCKAPCVHVKSSASTLSPKVSLQSRFAGAANGPVTLVLSKRCLGELVPGAGLAESPFSTIRPPTVCSRSRGSGAGQQKAERQPGLDGAGEALSRRRMPG